MKRFPPERIVCLTEETVETLYLLNEDKRIVGVSGYAVRPPRVRSEKPRVSAFMSADISKIRALEPDLVLTFSDLQADIAAALLREGIAVMGFNQRDIEGIFAMVATVGALVGASDKADVLIGDLRRRLAQVHDRVQGRARPTVYFEEWDDPMITGIRWVSELVEIAGGTDAFAAHSKHEAAKDRIIGSEAVIAANPDVILASWCGKKVRPEKIASRSGWDEVAAVRDDRIIEIKSPLILQPGPAALTDGLDKIVEALWP